MTSQDLAYMEALMSGEGVPAGARGGPAPAAPTWLGLAVLALLGLLLFAWWAAEEAVDAVVDTAKAAVDKVADIAEAAPKAVGEAVKAA